MALRTSEAEIKALLNTSGDYDTVNNPSVTRFHTSANLLTNRVATCAAAKGKTLTAEELENIEAWLGAHFYQMSDKGYQSRTTGDASATFAGKTTMRLEATLYGQTALTLDVSGCLDALNRRATASIDWLGKTETEAISYPARNGWGDI